MRRLIISTLVSLVYVVPAAAQLAGKWPGRLPSRTRSSPFLRMMAKTQTKKARNRSRKPWVNQLASGGLTDIEMAPLSFVARAKNADGKPVIFVLYPDANLEWQVSPVDEDDTSPSTPN